MGQPHIDHCGVALNNVSNRLSSEVEDAENCCDMGKNLIGTLLILAGFLLASVNANGQNLKEKKEGGQVELINGYHPSEFYYNTVTIPPDVEKSDKKEDRINVALHYKIVNYEKEAVRPLKSLEKNEMEAMLARFQAEVKEELGYAKPPAAPTEPPKKKPAIIGEEK